MNHKDHMELYGKRSEGKTSLKDGGLLGYPTSDETPEEIRQLANYTEYGKAMPDNNMFWEDGHNPLSSKGN